MLLPRSVGLAVLLTFATVAGVARCAQAATLAGAILDVQGKPVEGVEISVQDATGKTVASAVTNAKGVYAMEGIPPGQYHVSLNPLNTGFQGQTVVATVSEKGLTVSWTVSSTAPAVAAATPGIATAGGIFGLGTTGTFLGGVGLVGAGVGGGMAASNSGGDGGHRPVSPGQ
jgi:hypothetical protein